jgi:RNA polymerase sigma-70 factor, ECF subfamily
MMKQAVEDRAGGRDVAEQFAPFFDGSIGGHHGGPVLVTAHDDFQEETFVKVSRALAKGTTPEHFRGWLYQTARNTTIDFITESRRFVPLEDSIVNREAGKSESNDFGDNEFRKQLFSYTLKVIETLPAEDREVLTLTEVDGLSREELAEELGISLTAAKSRVHRARAKLRKAVEECCRLVTDPYGRVMDWRKRTLGSRVRKGPAT